MGIYLPPTPRYSTPDQSGNKHYIKISLQTSNPIVGFRGARVPKEGSSHNVDPHPSSDTSPGSSGIPIAASLNHTSTGSTANTLPPQCPPASSSADLPAPADPPSEMRSDDPESEDDTVFKINRPRKTGEQYVAVRRRTRAKKGYEKDT